MKEKLLSASIYLLTTALGIFAYIYPLLNFPAPAISSATRRNDLPLMMAILLVLCIFVIIFEVQQVRLSARLIALLGVLIAINATMRFIELALPVLGGFSPVFFLIMICGYVFGGRVGFLMGALSLFVSALVTGGVGPWLPNQMFTAGWVGMSATLVRSLVKLFHMEKKAGEIWLLLLFGTFWGFLYGAITNLWFWPFLSAPGAQAFSAGSGLLTSLRNYGIYYLATSFMWDAGRAIGNALLVFFFGRATLQVLARFQRRFHFIYIPSSERST